MFHQTVTVFHKTVENHRDKWTPILLEGVHFRGSTGMNAAGQSAASAPESRLIVRAAVWDARISEGDYVVSGSCDQAEFIGSAAAVLLPLGGRKIESITASVYGSEMDNYSVILK